jgi:hypothetical protein
VSVCVDKCLRVCRAGQNHVYIQFIFGNSGREITIYTAIYTV